MNFRHQIIQNVLFITFGARIISNDFKTEHELFELIEEQLEQNINQCAIDLSETQHLNSAGLGILVKILTKFRNKGGEVVLVQPSENISKLLIITKLSNIFTILNNQKEAIEEMAH